MQIWPCPKVGARYFCKPQTLPYPSKVKNSIYMGGEIKTQTKHNNFIKISSSKFEFFREKLTFWPLFDLQWPLNFRIFYHHLPDWRENWTWYFGASSAPFQLVKLKIQAFWFSIFYHFWHFLGSLGWPGIQWTVSIFMVNFFTPHPIIPQYICASCIQFPDLWVVSLTRTNANLTMSQSGGTSFL